MRSLAATAERDKFQGGQVTDGEIEKRLRRAPHRAGYRHAGPCTGRAAPEDSIQDPGAIGRIRPSDDEITAVIGEVLSQPYLLCGDGTSRKGDLHLTRTIADLQQAGRIVPAVLHEWKLLQSARDEVRAAQQEAKQIISAASERSDQARHIINDAEREAGSSREPG